MRLIFEEVMSEYFFELVLNGTDLEKLDQIGGLLATYVWEGDGIRDINIYLRKEKDKEPCHSSKEKKQVPEKGFLKTSSEKCTKESLRSKPSPSLIAKRVGGKKRLPKLKRCEETHES